MSSIRRSSLISIILGLLTVIGASFRPLSLKRRQDNGSKWPARTHFVGPGWLQLGACNTRSSLGVSNAFTVVQKIALTAVVARADNSNKRPLLGGGTNGQAAVRPTRIALQVRPKSPRRKID